MFAWKGKFFLFLCLGTFLLSTPAQEKLPRLHLLELMLGYKKYFGQYVLVKGLRAEQEADEFVLEALPFESSLLQKFPEAKNWKSEDLFINIRVEDVGVLKNIEKVPEGTPLLVLLEIRESSTYNKIIPVFVLHDFTIITLSSNEQQNHIHQKTEWPKKHRRKIKIRRR